MSNEFKEGLYYNRDSDEFVFNMIFDDETSATIYLTFKQIEDAIKYIYSIKDYSDLIYRIQNKAFSMIESKRKSDQNICQLLFEAEDALINLTQIKKEN